MFNLNILQIYFFQKIEPVNILKYANRLICIFEFYTKGQKLSFNLIPNLLFYHE